MTDELSMDQILAQSAETTPGGLVEGTVVGVTDSHVLINVGLKQEAALPLKEFSHHPPAVGTVLTLLLIREQGPEGRPLVSWRQARERQNWDVVAQAQQSQHILEGRITQRIKGGFIVDIGLDAFMPASQVDDRQGGNLESWVGQQIRVIVLEMDKAKGNVLVSRRRVVEQEKSVQRVGTLAHLEVGQIYKGTVRALANFGAFIDIGGVEGLLHVSDLDWKRIDNPNKVLKVGQEIEVKVLKYDTTSGRISLGRKQLMAHPWEGIEKPFSDRRRDQRQSHGPRGFRRVRRNRARRRRFDSRLRILLDRENQEAERRSQIGPDRGSEADRHRPRKGKNFIELEAPRDEPLGKDVVPASGRIEDRRRSHPHGAVRRIRESGARAWKRC